MAFINEPKKLEKFLSLSIANLVSHRADDCYTCTVECFMDGKCDTEQILDLTMQIKSLACNVPLAEVPELEEPTQSSANFTEKIHNNFKFDLLRRNETECVDLISSIQTNQYLGSFWNTFRNLIENEIVYYPASPLTDEIMKYANETFETLDLIRETTGEVYIFTVEFRSIQIGPKPH